MENLQLAHKRAIKGKRWQRAVKAFNEDVEGNIERIHDVLARRAFIPSEYRIKQIYEPKKRDIYIVPFSPDRIVHHAIMNILEPIWEKMFIRDSYACIKGKGMHAGSSRTMEFVRKHKYCLKCDIRKFYPSMHHDILFRIIQKKIKCPETLKILKDIIYSIPGGRNVPIGNYTSQWFGNLYMNELDQYVKHTNRIKNYARYSDDFVLFHDDKKHLREIAADLKAFLGVELGLTMSKCDVFPVTQGVDFLGYRHFPDHILLRRSTAARMKRRLRRLGKLFELGRVSIDRLRSSAASSLGWMRWANSYNLSISVRINHLLELCHAPAAG